MKSFNELSRQERAIGAGFIIFIATIFTDLSTWIFVLYTAVALIFFGARYIAKEMKEMDTPEYKERKRQELLVALREATQLKEWIKISYDAGSQPGAVREVFPLSLTEGETHLVATNDINEQEGARYRVDQIQLHSYDTEIDFVGPEVIKKRYRSGAKTKARKELEEELEEVD